MGVQLVPRPHASSTPPSNKHLGLPVMHDNNQDMQTTQQQRLESRDIVHVQCKRQTRFELSWLMVQVCTYNSKAASVIIHKPNSLAKQSKRSCFEMTIFKYQVAGPACQQNWGVIVHNFRTVFIPLLTPPNKEHSSMACCVLWLVCSAAFCVSLNTKGLHHLTSAPQGGIDASGWFQTRQVSHRR